MIQGTGNALKTYGTEIYAQATNDNTPELLKQAFNDVFETLNEVDTENKKAFPENELKIIELKKEE